MAARPKLDIQSDAFGAAQFEALVPMFNQVALWLLLISATNEPHAAGETFEEHFCGEAMSIYLPSPQGTPAPNIELKNFQYMSPDDRCGRNIDRDEIMRLHSAIKPIAAASFGESQARFAVMVRYTLTTDKPATFDMRVRDAPDSERPRLTAFHDRSSTLVDFHSLSGTAHVVFHYEISPSKKPAPAGGD
jgi:hypothetical protein